MSMLSACLTLLACATVAPQDPTPAAIVQPFEPMIGCWRGEGSYARAPDQPPLRWTATAQVRWILGGHFAQEDLQATLGDTRLRTRTVFGWDSMRDRFVAASVASSGHSHVAEVTWTSPATLVATSHEVVAGQPVLQRTVWEYGDERHGYRLERTTGSGAWQQVVAGEFVRVDALPPPADEADRDGGAVGAEMARVAVMVGEYAIDGERVDATGRTMVRATGTDSVRALYGGQTLAARTVLAAADAKLEAHRYVAWNPTDRHYDVFSFDDRGRVGISALRWDGEDVLAGATLETDDLGALLAATVVELGTEGIRTARTRSVRATGEITEQVSLHYRRAEEPR